jgi:hypothetical protein
MISDLNSIFFEMKIFMALLMPSLDDYAETREKFVET